MKTSHHHDFLYYKLGIANVEKSFKLDYQEEEFNQRQMNYSTMLKNCMNFTQM